MESVFPIVVFGAVVFSIVMSVAFLLTRGSLYDQIGDGGLTREGDHAGPMPEGAPESPFARAERELEIRQMLSARSDRQLRRGGPALDVEAEVAKLLAPAPAPAHEVGLTDEVRQLVVARNERRARRGLAPLEVEAEVARTLDELNP